MTSSYHSTDAHIGWPKKETAIRGSISGTTNEDATSFLVSTKPGFDEETQCASSIDDSVKTGLSVWLPAEEVTCNGKPQNSLTRENTTIIPAPAPWYFRLMGFPNDPLKNSSDLRLSLLSNYSSSYNVVSISAALAILTSPESRYHLEATASSQSVCSSALIAGMIVGQVSGGAFGDSIGRHVAMSIVMVLQIVASTGSAFSFGVGRVSIFHSLAVWRFLLGVGCGGVYPLAATLTAESTTAKEEKCKLVALTFSMQGLGYISVPIIGFALIKIFGESSDFTWRIILGLGCVPGVVLLFIRLKRRQEVMEQECPEINKVLKSLPVAGKKHYASTTSLSSYESFSLTSNLQETSLSDGNEFHLPVIEAIKKEKNLLCKLLGTAGTWFLFDIMFYGNTLFQRVVLAEAFGAAETPVAVCRDTFIVAAIALPGYFISVALADVQSPRHIQLQGFLVVAVLYTVIGLYFESLARQKGLLLALYGSTFLFSNYGPNSTTFMLPSMTFSFDCRSTLNGISAASGKLGALIGASLFQPVSLVLGDPVIMVLCGLLSVVGFALTHACIPDNIGRDKSEADGRDNTLGEDDGAHGEPFANSLAGKRSEGMRKTRGKLIRVRHSLPSLIDYIKGPDEESALLAGG